MKCPNCNNKEIELEVDNEEKYVEVQIYCPICQEIVAFHWIKDEDWITDI